MHKNLKLFLLFNFTTWEVSFDRDSFVVNKSDCVYYFLISITKRLLITFGEKTKRKNILGLLYNKPITTLKTMISVN